MARKANTTNDEEKMVSDSQGKDLPQTTEAGDTAPAVRDLPPANPLGEPVMPADAYPNTSEAGKQAAALGVETEETAGTDAVPGETIVEHPLSPTDANPNPHGQRSEDADTTIVSTDDKGISKRETRSADDTVNVTGTSDRIVHLGDGRTLAKGETKAVSKDVAKTLRDNGQAK